MSIIAREALYNRSEYHPYLSIYSLSPGYVLAQFLKHSSPFSCSVYLY